MAELMCFVDDCRKWADRKGMCFAHYYMNLRHGSPVPPKLTAAQRFFAKVDITEECWLWTAGTSAPYGHGNFKAEGKMWKAHRWAYEFENGPIKFGLVLDHVCRIPRCVNPDHLDPVTPMENMLRGSIAKPWLTPVPKRTALPKLSDEQRFWSKVEIGDANGCWLWTKGIQHHGHAQFSVNGKAVYAHRFAYELMVGPIPEGLVLDHLCSTPACVNPAHLEAVTPRENALRSRMVKVATAKTHCPRGHEYNSENTQLIGGRRFCRACKREKIAEKRADVRGPDWEPVHTNANRGKTHCKYGHPLEGDNLMVLAKQRRCRTCHNRLSAEGIARARERRNAQFVVPAGN